MKVVDLNNPQFIYIMYQKFCEPFMKLIKFDLKSSVKSIWPILTKIKVSDNVKCRPPPKDCIKICSLLSEIKHMDTHDFPTKCSFYALCVKNT